MAWSSLAAACLLLVLTGCGQGPAHVPDDVDPYNVHATQPEPQTKR